MADLGQILEVCGRILAEKLGKLVPVPIFLILLVGLLLPAFSYSQIEDVVGEDGPTSEAVYLADRLEELRKFPLDLNTAQYEEFLVIPWIDALTARRIIERRTQMSGFKSVADLLSVKRIGERELALIAQFVKVTSPTAATQKEKVTREGSQASFRIRARGDYPPRSMDELNIYERYGFKVKSSEVGLLLEKDKHEKTLTDFVALFLDVRGSNLSNEFIVGDYFLNFGQGLTLWTSGELFKGDESSGQARRRGRPMGGYTSSYENGALRGIALSMGNAGRKLYLYWSNSYLDGRIDTLGMVSSLPTSGVHYTDTEVAGKDKVQETLAGLRLEYGRKQSAKVGITVVDARYDPILSPEIFHTYSTARGGERERLFGGIDFALARESGDIFGELAAGERGALSGVLGWERDLEDIRLSFLLRHLDSEMGNLRSSPFTSSGFDGETGGYLGFEAKLPSRIRVSSYLDASHRSGGDGEAPSVKDFVVRGERKFGKSVLITVRDKYMTGVNLKNSARIQADWKVTPHMDFRSRYTRSSFSGEGGEKAKGDLFYTGFSFQMHGKELSSRVVFFDSNAALVRLYEYEDDLPGYISVRSLSGRGVRYYVLGKVKLRGSSLVLKYSETAYAGRDRDKEIGISFDGKFVTP
ncbi:MAG: helix-hairpin-helix domain-containing protein [Candidatus Eisenbacteria bacterium]|nr:helix-hairpin-helix domain-containing protein [Candidatus Eisenbacteria bacterium]